MISLTITDITNEASGVGRHEGIAVFVPGTAVGDQLKVRIVKVLKNYAYGIVESIVKASSDRIKDICPVSRQCGDAHCVIFPILLNAGLSKTG